MKNLGEVSFILRTAGLDVTVTRANGKAVIMLPEVDASHLAEMVQRKDALAAPPKLTVPDVPAELAHALEVDPDHEYVSSCHDQWLERGFLSEKQLEVLGNWRAG